MAVRKPGNTPPPARAVDRVPPQNEEGELGLLGSILIDGNRVMELCIERQVSVDFFYKPVHQCLFGTMREMYNRHEPIDLLTVINHLRASGRLDEAGGVDYLEGLVDRTPTSAHFEFYLDLVRRAFLLRSVIQRAREAIERCYKTDLPTEDILAETEQAFFSIRETQTVDARPWNEVVWSAMEGIERIIQNRGATSGLLTGFRDLDQMLNGMQSGDMLILAARPSMGKTSLAMNIAENIATGGHPVSRYGDGQSRPVAIFSLEMSKESLVRRMICSRAGIPWRVISQGYVDKEKHLCLTTAADALRKARIYLDDTPALSPVEIRARARRLKAMYGIEFIVIDYLQIMNYPEYKDQGRQQEVAAISSGLKAMAKELNVPVFVLSQLSRAPEERGRGGIPKLSDLRDSGSIEQDADVVMLLRRPSRIKGDSLHGDKTLAIIDIAKQRNGPTGELKLNFDDEITRFEDRKHGVDEAYVAPSEGGIEE